MKVLCRNAIVLLALLISACASHKVTQAPELTFDTQMLGKSTQSNGVHMIAKPIYKEEELESYFDDNLLKYSILPVQMNISNKGYDGNLLFSPSSISMTTADGATCPQLSLEQIYDEVKKSYGRTVGWTVAFGAIGAGVSAANVATTNNKIRRDYEGKMINKDVLPQGGETEGFVFFSVPEKTESLDGWELSLLLKDSLNDKRVAVNCPMSGQIDLDSTQASNSPEPDSSEF